MKKIAVMTLKGGTGKTTTAVNISHGFSLSGKKVLLIDCDPQRNAAVTFGVETDKGLDHLLSKGDVDIMQVRENFFLIDSGGMKLAEVEKVLGRWERGGCRLAESLQYLKGCDYVVCDCPPSINIINDNVLAYCEEMIIPVAMDFLSHIGVEQTIEMVDESKNLTARGLVDYWILPTFYDSRTRISKIILEKMRGLFGNRMFNTVIRVNTALREAPAHGKTIYEHAPLSRGAFDYYKLTEEIIERNGAAVNE